MCSFVCSHPQPRSSSDGTPVLPLSMVPTCMARLRAILSCSTRTRRLVHGELLAPSPDLEYPFLSCPLGLLEGPPLKFMRTASCELDSSPASLRLPIRSASFRVVSSWLVLLYRTTRSSAGRTSASPSARWTGSRMLPSRRASRRPSTTSGTKRFFPVMAAVDYMVNNASQSSRYLAGGVWRVAWHGNPFARLD